MFLAADVPRHGPDRRHLAAAVPRLSERAHVAGGVPAEAVSAGCTPISKYKATISGGPNFAYDLCVRKITPEQRETLDLSNWALAFNGAEPVREDTIESFTRTFEPCGFRREAFYPCYGLAEATLIVSGGYRSAPPVIRHFDAKALENNQVVDALADEEGSRSLVGCGGNLLDEEIVIANPETMTRCAADEVGEIWVTGPSVAQGYWKRPEDTEHTFRAYLADSGRGPYLRTGDLGFMQDGELFVTGRIKDLIIVRGVNHYPQDIELTVERSHRAMSAPARRRVHRRGGGPRAAGHRERGRARSPSRPGIVRADLRRHPPRHFGRARVAGRRHRSRSRPAAFPRHRAARFSVMPSRTVSSTARSRSVGQWRAWDKPVAAGRSARRTRAVRPKLTASTNGAAATTADRAPLAAFPQQTAQIVLDEVRKIAKERAGDLTLETNILELGLDSLERMEIVAALEDTFRRSVSRAGPRRRWKPARRSSRPSRPTSAKLRAPRAQPRDAEIPPENYRFDLYPEYLALKQNMRRLAGHRAGQPVLQPARARHQRHDGDRRPRDDQLVELQLSGHVGRSGRRRRPQRSRSTATAPAFPPAGSSSGEKPVHRELERAIADFLGVEDAICFVGGHSTNETTIGHLFGAGRPDPARQPVAQQHHPRLHSLAALAAVRFRTTIGRRSISLLATCGTTIAACWSSSRAFTAWTATIPICRSSSPSRKRHKAFLMVDEAHSAGTMGLHGRGIAEHFDINPADVDIWMGTLSKSYGSCGGYIAGTKALVEYLKYTCPGFVYSVGMPPSNAAAALASLRLLEDEPQRVARLHRNAGLFLTLAKSAA